MIRIRLLQNTIFFVDRVVTDGTGVKNNGQRQWHVQRGDIHAVEKIETISDHQYNLILPSTPVMSEVVRNVEKDILEVIQDVPTHKPSPGGCGGCGGQSEKEDE
jgi:hypothetical protein